MCFLLLALLSALVILIPKPLILWRRHRAGPEKRGEVSKTSGKSSTIRQVFDEDDYEVWFGVILLSYFIKENQVLIDPEPEKQRLILDRIEHGEVQLKEEFNFGEVFVHQVIETIEFVLGRKNYLGRFYLIFRFDFEYSKLSSSLGFVVSSFAACQSVL